MYPEHDSAQLMFCIYEWTLGEVSGLQYPIQQGFCIVNQPPLLFGKEDQLEESDCLRALKPMLHWSLSPNSKVFSLPNHQNLLAMLDSSLHNDIGILTQFIM